MPSSLRLHALGSRAGAALALAARLWLASIWWTFGILKIRAGWLDTGGPTGNPLRPLLELIAAGQLPTTWPVFRPVARLLLDAGLDAALVLLIPVTELALAACFALGVAPRVAAALGIAVNLGLVAAGIGDPWLDGRVIAVELLVLATGPLAGAWSAPRLLRRRRRRANDRARDPLTTSAGWPSPRGAAG